MNLKALYEEALSVARDYHSCESRLIEMLQRLDHEQAFVWLGCSSLFSFAVQKMGLSEPLALALINVARTSRQVPALLEAVKAGSISLWTAKKLCSVIEPENQDEWLSQAKTL